MSRHESTLPSDLAQQLVQRGSVRPVLDRVHPHQHPVETVDFVAHLVHGVIGVHDWHGVDTEFMERHEDIGQPSSASNQRWT